jgi:hypothetical protein
MILPDRSQDSGNLPPMGSVRRDRIARRENIVWSFVFAIVAVFLLGLAFHGFAGRRYMTASGPPILIKTTPETTSGQGPTVPSPQDAR